MRNKVLFDLIDLSRRDKTVVGTLPGREITRGVGLWGLTEY